MVSYPFARLASGGRWRTNATRAAGGPAQVCPRCSEDRPRAKGREILMSRGERVTSSSFGQFMASTAGRATRGVVGVVLIVVGLIVGSVGGWVLVAFGLLLLAAGVFDFCVITGLFDNIWSGAEVRARGRRGEAPRTA